jgi:hypothetical protein
MKEIICKRIEINVFINLGDISSPQDKENCTIVDWYKLWFPLIVMPYIVINEEVGEY